MKNRVFKRKRTYEGLMEQLRKTNIIYYNSLYKLNTFFNEPGEEE